jgi:hypothetical protein
MPLLNISFCINMGCCLCSSQIPVFISGVAFVHVPHSTAHDLNAVCTLNFLLESINFSDTYHRTFSGFLISRVLLLADVEEFLYEFWGICISLMWLLQLLVSTSGYIQLCIGFLLCS